MKTPTFTGVFASDLERYLAFKTSTGIQGTSRLWYLKSFDRYCTEHGSANFDRSTVEGWVSSRASAHPDSNRNWMSYIRDFGRWLRINGDDNAYVLSDQWKARSVRPQPYLLTQEEVTRFFQTAAEVGTDSPWKWQGLAFFALMHSCGLRTCEARRLTVNDVNLTDGYINVHWSKGNRSRQLPLTDQVLEILGDCDQALERALGDKRTTFFASPTGNPVTASMVGIMFSRIWDQAGLPRLLEGGCLGPDHGGRAGVAGPGRDQDPGPAPRRHRHHPVPGHRPRHRSQHRNPHYRSDRNRNRRRRGRGLGWEVWWGPANLAVGDAGFKTGSSVGGVGLPRDLNPDPALYPDPAPGPDPGTGQEGWDDPESWDDPELGPPPDPYPYGNPDADLPVDPFPDWHTFTDAQPWPATETNVLRP